ncbi:MAG: hypothetical protein ACRENG_36210 [bacterium]
MKLNSHAISVLVRHIIFPALPQHRRYPQQFFQEAVDALTAGCIKELLSKG